MQSEAAECGLACMATIADHHGMHTSMAELRQHFPLSLKGVKLTQLMHIGRRLGFQVRAVRLEMEGLSQLTLPCVLHWDLNHFVVLHSLKAGKARVLDPARGERYLTLAEVSEHFTGVALEARPDVGFQVRRRAPAVTLRQLTGGVHGLPLVLMQLLGLSVALQLMVLVGPFFMQWVVDQVLLAADRGLMMVLAVGFSSILIIQVAVAQLRGWAVIHLSARLNQQWSSNVFAHVLRLPMDFFEKRNLGDITSRLSSVQSIQRTITTSFVEAIMDGLLVLVTLAMMLLYSARLAAVSLIAVGIYAGIRWLAYRRLRTVSERQLMAVACQQTYLLESIRGMQSLKLARAESLRHSNYENLIVGTVNQDQALAKLNLGFVSINQLLFGLERILVVSIGALLAMDNVFSVGMLIAYLAYKEQFALRVAALIDKSVDFRMLRLHGERLADIVLTAPEEAIAPSVAVGIDGPRVDVEDVSFRYADGEPWVIRHCSFSVQPGESVAIVGPSGCGKTTLLKVMLGLLRPSEGIVRVGGQDIREIGNDRLRSMVAAVMQEDQLFAGSIADNIAFFEPEADTAAIEAASRLAAVHDEIVAMPMGYHSLIGDMGTTLSGGQKQRVILARALYRNPQLLFLDEATSHLDVMKEKLVNAAIMKLQLTRIIIAHRPDTIASADRVIALHEGRVVSSGVQDVVEA